MARPKGTTAVKSAPTTLRSNPDMQLDLLKSKLLKKYHLLKRETLKQDNRNDLLNFVCQVLGMTRPELDWIVKDL